MTTAVQATGDPPYPNYNYYYPGFYPNFLPSLPTPVYYPQPVYYPVVIPEYNLLTQLLSNMQRQLDEMQKKLKELQDKLEKTNES